MTFKSPSPSLLLRRCVIALATIGASVALIILFAGCSSAYHQVETGRTDDLLHATFMNTPTGTARLSDFAPAGLTPSPDEELWIIEQPAGVEHPQRPGTGMLLTLSGMTLTPLPLEVTEIRANVAGCIASVDVHQRFANPSIETTEVVYAFPLPTGGVVSEFVMNIGPRHIRGIVRERAEAEQFYKEARAQGLHASLLVQQGPDMFVQRAANLTPGGKIDVNIRYFQTIPCRAGRFELAIPIVVKSPTSPPMKTRSGRDLSVVVHFDPDMSIGAMGAGPTHAMSLSRTATGDSLTLDPADRIPNQDLIVGYKLAGDATQSILTTESDGDGGVFSFVLIPEALPPSNRQPLNVLLILCPDAGKDVNAIVGQVLHSLTPEDTFAILYANAGAPALLIPAALPANSQNISHAVELMAPLKSAGCPTIDLLNAAINQAPDPQRQQIICPLTNGRDIPHSFFPHASELLGPTRILPIATSADANGPALTFLARAGGGPALYLPTGKDHAQLLADLFNRLSHPFLTEPKLTFPGSNVSDIYPDLPRALFHGEVIHVMGRYHGAPPASCTVSVNVDGHPLSWRVRPTPAALPGRAPLACLWASRKIAGIIQSDTSLGIHPSQQIRDIALEYGVVSPFTSFIAVDAIGDSTEAVGSGMMPQK